MYTVESQERCVIFASGGRRLRVGFVSPSIARITVTEGHAFKGHSSLIVETAPSYMACSVTETPTEFVLSTDALKVVLAKESGAVSYLNAQGELLLRQPDRGGTWLTEKDVFKNVYSKDATIATGQSIDGARASVDESQRVFDRKAFEAKLEFVFSEDEALFGFGSHEEGYGNLRGKSRELYQQNMKAVVPYFVSTKSYGVLLDCYSLMTFHDDALGSYVWADVVDQLDYYFISGSDFDDVTRGYHSLTGRPPMLPKWAFGYIQSKERYVNAREMLEIVGEYRRRKIPLDVIVLDWKSWPNGDGWGQKSFDPKRFPDPKGFTSALHEMGARLMVSIWPITMGGCPNQRELQDHGLMLGNQATYDAFSEGGRRVYWEQANQGLFSQGIDAWWCDCTEPFEADWSGAVKPEPHRRLAINTEQSKKYIDAGLISAYSLLHSKGIYEGQRRTTDQKRVVNLTRSSYAGQHRYATITWSGDICATWETLRRSIPEGLNFCATGEPYWTVDIGGFFINNDPKLWFWRGDYAAGCRGLTEMTALEPDPQDTGCTDKGFWELYTRWVQYAVFLPMFRSHGTDAAREIWRFGDEGTPFYDTIARYIRLRYELLPYIYSVAARVTFASESFIRALALAFPSDRLTHDINDQFMFGPSLMVCPVTKPMYFETQSRPLHEVAKTRAVYLPAGFDWYDFWTGVVYAGGQTIQAPAPLETIPVYVRAGSVIPLCGVPVQHSSENPNAPYELRVYAGVDTAFDLYEDDGDTYAYERGEHSIISLRWQERPGAFTVSARTGTYSTKPERRKIRVSIFSHSATNTFDADYAGTPFEVRIPKHK